MFRERFGDFQLLAHQTDDVSGSLEALHERCSTRHRMGEVRVCALNSKVTPRGRKVVGLRRTCAGLSCLMLDVFLCGVPGCII